MLDLMQKNRDGLAIAQAREDRGWSQEDLARHTGLQPSAISHFETGTRRPSFGNLLKLADALEISVDQLMGRATTTGKTATVQDLLGELSFDDLDLVERFARMLLGRKAN